MTTKQKGKKMTDKKKIIVPIFVDDDAYKEVQNSLCGSEVDCYNINCSDCLFDTRNTKEFKKRFERLHD